MTHIVDLQLPWRQAIKQTLTIQRQNKKLNRRLSRVSVIYVVRNSDQAVAALEQIHLILKETLVRELVVIDCTGSEDFEGQLKTLDLSRFPFFIIQGQPQYSLAQAYNLGSRYSTSKILLLMHDQMPLTALLMQQVLRLKPPEGFLWILGVQDAAFPSLDPMMAFESGDYQALTQEKDLMQEGGMQVPTVASSGVLLPKEVFSELGEFDSKCLDAAVIRDFCCRIHYDGGDVVSHPLLQTDLPERFKPTSLKALRKTWQGWDYYYKKHFGKVYRRWHGFLLLFKLAKSLFSRSTRSIRQPTRQR